MKNYPIIMRVDPKWHVVERYHEETHALKYRYYLDDEERMQGTVHCYRSDGTLAETVCYYNGYRHGARTLYDTVGRPYAREYYQRGSFVKRFAVTEDGKEIQMKW